jgi:glycosyltransferase involved in cell wall biosynthesis
VFSEHARIVRVPPTDILRFPPPGWGTDLVVASAAMADILRTARQRRFLRTLNPELVNVHDIEWNLFQLGAFTRYAVLGKVGARLFSRIQSVPSLLTKHFVFESEFSSPSLRVWEQKFTLQFKTIVCVDQGVRNAVQSWADRSHIDADVLFIPNSVDTKLFRPEPPPASDSLRVGFAGRLDRVRGESLLTKFLERLPDFVEFHGAIAADDRRFGEFSRRFGSHRIHLSRNVPQSEMPRFFSRIHVLLNPLAVGYGVSRVTLEAMAAGRCVLMVGSGDRYPLVTGETGLIVPSNLDEINLALNRLWRSPEILQAIGRKARNRIMAEFSNDIVLPKLEKVYHSVAAGGNGQG